MGALHEEKVKKSGGASERHEVREAHGAMKLLINGRVDMKYSTLTYRVSVMYS